MKSPIQSPILRIVLASLFALALLAACDNGEKAQAPQKKVTAGDVKKETQEAMAAAKTYTSQEKDEYLGRVKAEMEDLDRRIEELRSKAEARASTMTEQGKAEYQKAMDELREKKQAADTKYESLKSSSADAWDDMKAGMSASLEDLGKAVKRAQAHFEQ